MYYQNEKMEEKEIVEKPNNNCLRILYCGGIVIIIHENNPKLYIFFEFTKILISIERQPLSHFDKVEKHKPIKFIYKFTFYYS